MAMPTVRFRSFELIGWGRSMQRGKTARHLFGTPSRKYQSVKSIREGLATLPQELYDMIFDMTFTINVGKNESIYIDRFYRHPAVMQVCHHLRQKLHRELYEGRTLCLSSDFVDHNFTATGAWMVTFQSCYAWLEKIEYQMKKSRNPPLVTLWPGTNNFQRVLVDPREQAPCYIIKYMVQHGAPVVIMPEGQDPRKLYGGIRIALQEEDFQGDGWGPVSIYISD